MTDLRLVNAALGILMAVLGTMMMVPAIIDLVHGHDEWIVFAVAAAVTVCAGAMLWLTGRQAEPARLTLRQAFLLTSFAWVALSAFAGLSLTGSEANLSFTRAFFETMSGLTTTGPIVLTGLDWMAPGILIWRSCSPFMCYWRGSGGDDA